MVLVVEPVATSGNAGKPLRALFGKLDLSDAVWNFISPHATSLLRLMLHKSVSWRITAAEAVLHPFLTGSTGQQVLPYSPALVMVSMTIPYMY